MDTLNEQYFKNDDYRRVAGGANMPRLVRPDGGSGEAEWSDWSPGDGGLVSTRSEYIPGGTVLVRFGGLKATKIKDEQTGLVKQTWTAPQYFGPGAAAGAWWLDLTAYKAIERYADAIGESVTYAVRQVCAVPAEWSDLSYVVQGRTRSPLMAWAGLGRSVMAKDGTIIDPLAPGKPQIEQYFIPGMWDPDFNKAAIFISHHGPLDPVMGHPGARRQLEERAAQMKRMRAAMGKS